MKADGSEQRALTQTPDYDYSPAWSPDGERIAFQRQYPSPGAAINDEIVVVNVDGSDFRRLTRNRSFDDCSPPLPQPTCCGGPGSGSVKLRPRS
jgi:TolB protein